MGTRRNILSLPLADVQRLTAAFNTLKANGTYNTVVERHMRAMMEETPAGDTTTDRNIAHRGPSFLAWHRAALLELADALRAVDPAIDDLPYWDWAADQALAGGPKTSKLWTNDYFGPNGDPYQNNRVLTGPFKDWRARIYVASSNTFRDRSYTGLVRQLGSAVSSLPTNAQVNDLLTNSAYTVYDASPWSESSSLQTFRNRLEGFYTGGAMHNRVHTWVGGDMRAGTSPNDPVFWLNHCNVDRVWWQWQQKYGINTYQPESGGPAGHNLNDTMTYLITPRTPASVLNLADLGYTYA